MLRVKRIFRTIHVCFLMCVVQILYRFPVFFVAYYLAFKIGQHVVNMGEDILKDDVDSEALSELSRAIHHLKAIIHDEMN